MVQHHLKVLNCSIIKVDDLAPKLCVRMESKWVFILTKELDVTAEKLLWWEDEQYVEPKDSLMQPLIKCGIQECHLWELLWFTQNKRLIPLCELIHLLLTTHIQRYEHLHLLREHLRFWIKVVMELNLSQNFYS